MITPWQRECQGHIGKNNAKYFDQRGALYFTKEVFDLLPLVWRHVAHVPRRRGHDLRTRRRTPGAPSRPPSVTLTLGYRIQNHMESGLSTIESTGQHVDRMLKEFAAYHRRNAEMPGRLPSVRLPGVQRPRQVDVTDLLDANGIRYGKAGKASNGKAP